MNRSRELEREKESQLVVVNHDDDNDDIECCAFLIYFQAQKRRMRKKLHYNRISCSLCHIVDSCCCCCLFCPFLFPLCVIFIEFQLILTNAVLGLSHFIWISQKLKVHENVINQSSERCRLHIEMNWIGCRLKLDTVCD